MSKEASVVFRAFITNTLPTIRFLVKAARSLESQRDCQILARGRGRRPNTPENAPEKPSAPRRACQNRRTNHATSEHFSDPLPGSNPFSNLFPGYSGGLRPRPGLRSAIPAGMKRKSSAPHGAEHPSAAGWSRASSTPECATLGSRPRQLRLCRMRGGALRLPFDLLRDVACPLFQNQLDCGDNFTQRVSP